MPAGGNLSDRKPAAMAAVLDRSQPPQRLEIPVSLASWFRSLFSPRPDGPKSPIGRNDVCWCGSGKKYKKCHLKNDELKRVEASYSAHISARNRMGDGVMPGSGKKKKPGAPEAAPRPAERG
jgi:hypothetical protein